MFLLVFVLLAAGNAYVVKPVQFQEFVRAVKLVGAFWAVVNEPPPGSLRAAGRKAE